ncbi:mucin-17-like [Thunnus maccoyii]|uniref:mucin-17-like n=1 Tax=Thunnus maccoyii TaxID=8240 RepID=UPI001C4B1452|nr:mucin-17-like [Thunnus maccoyii]
MSQLLLLLLLLVCSSQASHFYGTVMTYYPTNTHADGSVMVKLSLHACTNSTLQCFFWNCRNESLVLSTVDEGSNVWCLTEEISILVVPSNPPLLLPLAGFSWISNIKNNIVSWRAVALVELRNRSDTGQANISPQTTILPVVRVPSNCQRDFNLLAFDPDGDEVKCRYGNDTNTLQECNPCTPPSVLNLSSSCTLSFSPTNSSNEGAYAVQLMMEDFPRQTINLTLIDGSQEVKTTNDAISKIPVQFVLRVDPAVPSCTEGLYLPKFLPPTPANRAQLYTSVNQTLEISIHAEANNSTISELLFSGPYNINETTLGTGRFILRWTPSESENGESHPVCFVVQAELNSTTYQSEFRCVIVTVGNATTIPTISTPTTPSTITPQNLTTFSWTTTPQTTTPNDTSTTQSSTNVSSTTASATNFSSTTTPQTTTPNNTSTTQSSTNVSSTTASATNFSSTTTPQTTTPNNTSTTQSSTNVSSTTASATNFSSTTAPQTATPNNTSTTLSSTSPHSVTTPQDTTLDISNNFVVGLNMRISSSYPLSEDYIRNTVIQQLKDELVRHGLPSDISLRLVSSVKLEVSNTTADGSL